ncbi:hypothetical protein ACH5RR_005125 [Cinchona calisaya]|uniref:Uncharacterized protein n=1 Tax=Cinchona calisaya TaxID=153742 RepID=A0ABD3AKH3_9GENT
MLAEQRTWKLNVQSKSNNLDLRIKATEDRPSSSGCSSRFSQFSLRLKLSPLVINFKLKPKTSIWWKPKKIKSNSNSSNKFLNKIVEKFRIRFSNNRDAATARRTSFKGWRDYIYAENLALLWIWIVSHTRKLFKNLGPRTLLTTITTTILFVAIYVYVQFLLNSKF